MTDGPVGESAVPAAATWGLFVAWAIHDAEELATMAHWTRRARPRLEAALPWVPAAVWDRMDFSQEHVNLSVGLVGCVVAAAAADGARTNGRSPLYQTTLAALGLHAVSHVASAVVTRGYTPGVVTAPLVAAPFSLWARRELRRAGVPTTSVRPTTALLFVPLVAAVHGTAPALLAAGRRLRRGFRRR
ncbi:HXXEE domain-containing protein [Thermobifida halotolerans]|uniref:HXXEE domain-containing protein n=1 Tax=Thermobifida halotolerans TaxID=483545 RepID=A0A399FWC7_9ACTN|nr:HXXEE domain-containing protein [Thermobifida halotolerans]UOE19070.1 HXXEE domain-containing protein [Thermobifida halotolerans]